MLAKTPQLQQILDGEPRFYSHADEFNPFKRGNGSSMDIITLKADHPTKYMDNNTGRPIGSQIRWLDRMGSQPSSDRPSSQQDTVLGRRDNGALAWLLQWLGDGLCVPSTGDIPSTTRDVCSHILSTVAMSLVEDMSSVARSFLGALMAFLKRVMIPSDDPQHSAVHGMLPERIRSFRVLLQQSVLQPRSVNHLLESLLSHLGNPWSMDDLGEISNLILLNV